MKRKPCSTEQIVAALTLTVAGTPARPVRCVVWAEHPSHIEPRTPLAKDVYSSDDIRGFSSASQIHAIQSRVRHDDCRFDDAVSLRNRRRSPPPSR